MARTAHELVRRVARRAGVQRIPAAVEDEQLTSRHEQRRRLIDALGVDLVLDGGANLGQYAGDHLRVHSGYAGRIVSFEPVPATYEQLARRAAPDAGWRAMPYGLSDVDERITFTLPGENSNLASVDALRDEGRQVVQGEVGRDSRVEGELRRLDGLGIVSATDRALLKLDVQGHEPQALRGAAGVLERVAVIECEMPLRPLYVGQGGFAELLEQLSGLGFAPVGMHSNWVSGEGLCFDADVFLVR